MSREQRPIRRVCVYCGSSGGGFVARAREFGGLLAARGIELVYGGGGVGLMGAVADGVLAGGGRVTGVIPQFLEDKELGHKGVQTMHVVETMHERKLKMMELADAFVTLPGGFGTLEELFEVLAWSQLQLHAKPVGVLNWGGYYDGLLACLERMVEERLLRGKDRERMMDAADGAGLLAQLEAWEAPSEAKWEDPEFWDERI